MPVAFSATLAVPPEVTLGVSLIEVETTVVVALLAVVVPSFTVMVKVVVSVDPGATRFSAGSKTSWRIAAWALAGSVAVRP